MKRLQNAQLHRRSVACEETMKEYLSPVRLIKERREIGKIRAQSRRD